MSQNSTNLDNVFASLSDPTRRDILKRVKDKELTVSEIAKPYNVTLAAISKHLSVLERAKLIVKRKQGKQQFVKFAGNSLDLAAEYLKNYV